jgi:hypothetical protein
VLVKALLGRLIIIGNNQETGIDANPLRLSGRLQGFGGAVTAGIGNYGTAASYRRLHLRKKPYFLPLK